MNQLSSRTRKIIYLVGILVLLIPIIWLGIPASGSDSEGGRLAGMRKKYDLGENQLGQIDPTSSAMNLVLLGFRGIAADMIWLNALDNEDTKNWAELRSNVDAIIMLQPHFVKVWQFQGWNLAWNVSAAWDLVADRFYWVKEGAKFLKQGCVVNEKIAQLPYDTGRVLGQKIGRADEWRYYRKFFKTKDPNEDRYKGGPDTEINPKRTDNYLAAKDEYLRANDLQTKYRQSIGMLEPLFRGYPYRSQMSYPDALQREGEFDEVSRTGWEEAYREWVESYGQMQFISPVGQYHLEMSPKVIEAEAKAQNADVREYRGWVIRMLEQTRYPYWKLRAQAEASPTTDKNGKPLPSMVEAHRLIFEGQKQFRSGNLSAAKDSLYRGMTVYQQILDRYPVLAGEDDTVEECMTAVLYWQKILKLQFQTPPKEFPLSSIWVKGQSNLSQIEARFKRETGQN